MLGENTQQAMGHAKTKSVASTISLQIIRKIMILKEINYLSSCMICIVFPTLFQAPFVHVGFLETTVIGFGGQQNLGNKGHRFTS